MTLTKQARLWLTSQGEWREYELKRMILGHVGLISDTEAALIYCIEVKGVKNEISNNTESLSHWL